MKTNIHFFWIGLLLLLTQGMTAQQMVLSLEKTIQLAADSSLEAFRSKNLYLTGYWEFRNYKAERLPSLTLNLTPAQYYRDITKRYDSEADIDVYRKQQSFYAGGSLNLKQNFDWLGGSFYIDSDLGYMRSERAGAAPVLYDLLLRHGGRLRCHGDL